MLGRSDEALRGRTYRLARLWIESCWGDLGDLPAGVVKGEYLNHLALRHFPIGEKPGLNGVASAGRYDGAPKTSFKSEGSDFVASDLRHGLSTIRGYLFSGE